MARLRLDRARILALSDKGKWPDEIASEIGCRVQTVWKVLRAERPNRPRKPRPPREEHTTPMSSLWKAPAVRALAKKGIHPGEIARLLDSSLQNVKSVLRHREVLK